MGPRKDLPSETDLLWPTLQALEELGGSASIYELSERLAIDLGLSDEVMDIPHGDGPQTEVNYRAAWARTRLRWIKAIDNTSRAVWTITELGRRLKSEDAVLERLRRLNQKNRNERRDFGRKQPASGNEEVPPEEMGWEEALLGILRGISPDAFERLCMRVLREYGFTKVEVTGRPGDEGIDGTGVLRINLISFHVNYQCKRYSGPVGPSSIRDFRGAMVGRADKGLFITTGRFTRKAEREAVRDGAPPIDLIDGIELCGLLRDKNLGVSTTTVEVFEPDPEFFARL